MGTIQIRNITTKVTHSRKTTAAKQCSRIAGKRMGMYVKTE